MPAESLKSNRPPISSPQVNRPGIGRQSVPMTRALVVIFRPPTVKVTPPVVE